MATSRNLADYRSYLRVLARQCVGRQLRAKIDSSDLVQETLVNVAKREDVFLKLTPEERLPYLRACLTNELRDQRRRYYGGKRMVARERSLNDAVDESSQNLEHWIAADLSSPSEQAVKTEMLCALARSIDSLPFEQREAFEMKYLAGHTLQEVASELDKTVPQIAGLLRRAKEKLRDVLGGSDDQ